jgi:hypothetical protein
MRTLRSLLFGMALAALAAWPAWAQQPPVKVTITESEKVEASESYVPVDPAQRVEYRYVGNFCYGLYVDGVILCCGDGAIRPSVKVDNQQYFAPQAPAQPLPPGKNGKPRAGMQCSFTPPGTNVTITQILEVIPSKVPPKSPAGQKRKRDTLLTKYVIENKDTKPHMVGVRVRIDTMVRNNDGALFASPTTHPGKILNGIELKGKELPEWMQILEMPNLQNPGFVGYYTLKVGRLEGPNRFACTAHFAGENGWDVQVVAANGDSDCVIYFDPVAVPAGGKREVGYAYGGGIASNPESEGKVQLQFGGSFEPGKEFTITAYVDDPVEGQSLSLELPKGLGRLDGKSTQAVPPATGDGPSVVLWKARVEELGTYPLVIRSSNGVTYTRTLTISRPGGDKK